jgi:hypothetical protein
MTPAELHLRVLALLGEEPSRGLGVASLRGVAWHDGECLELRDERTNRVLCTIADDLVERVLPVRGRLVSMLPGIDYYAVCGPEVLAALSGESSTDAMTHRCP